MSSVFNPPHSTADHAVILWDFDDWSPQEVVADFVQHHLKANPVPQEDPEQRLLRRRMEEAP